MDAIRVVIRLCGGTRFPTKAAAIRQALSSANLPLPPGNVLIERGPQAQLFVSLTKGSTSTVLMERQGERFNGPTTPAEIVETIRKAL